MDSADVARMRAAARACLWPGGRPAAPARGEVLARRADDDVLVEDVRVRPPDASGDPVPALLARPHTGTPPVVVCLPGTGGDRSLLMERDCVLAEGRFHGWGRELARRGLAVLALTHRCGPGRAGDMREWAKGEQLHGRTAMGALVGDVMAALDYLGSRPDLNGARAGVVGFSLGGITAFYTAVVDERVRAAVPVCGGVGSLEALLDHGQTAYHSTYYYVPGLLGVGDHAGLLAAVAPRALLVLAAEEDPGMPADGVGALERAGRRLYAGCGCPDAFAAHVAPGGHAFTPDGLERTAAWLRRHLVGGGA